MPLDDVARTGDQLATLKELRDLLSDKLVAPGLDGGEVATLTGRLLAVLTMIAAIEPDGTKGTALDEFSKRREARKTKSPSRAEKRQQRR